VIRLKDKKRLVEAILFATHEGFTTEEIAKRIKIDDQRAEKIIKQLRKEIKIRESGLEIVKEQNKWRMRIQFKLLPVVKDLLPTDLPVSVVKTLAVIAWKSPVKQSEIIHIRGNKAYDHIKRLKEKEFVSSRPHGRTKILNLGKKFYQHFDITKKELKKSIDVEEKETKEPEKEVEIEVGR
jgi:segregation and condensation protein B